MFGMVSGPSRLDLQLGGGRHYVLVIQIRAGDARLALDALPITRLEIKPGAGTVELDLASPNLQTMSLLTIGRAGPFLRIAASVAPGNLRLRAE